MNFYQAQDNARRKTWQLGLLFAAAVLTLVLLTNILVVLVVMFTASGTTTAGMSFAQALQQIPADSWVFVTIGVVGVIAVASLFKSLSLRCGGRSIAESLGGRLLNHQTTNANERRLLNIVEEMAIASGIAVPPVYLIPESSINAFAAGFSPDDAVIGINQGTLDLLNREELQGVVAHEFSHILNGDTRINLRLIAILHGILFIGMIGYGIMRTGGFSRRNGVPVVMLGVGLLIVGYGGTFFGNLIKAAVSRQREYLADASAVQFTRNPDGIANALKKIGGATQHSYLVNDAAEQASHMFFGAAAKKFASNMFATHPPLNERISAIQPDWDGQFTAGQSPTRTSSPPPGAAGFSGSAEQVMGFTAGAAAMAERVGRPDQDSLESARQAISNTKDAWLNAAHDPYDARAAVYAMLLSHDADVARSQLAHLQDNADPGIADRTAALHDIEDASSAQKLVLLELAVPALKQLSKSQYQRFMHNTATLITADNQVDVFEWVLHRLLTKDLYGHFEGPQNYHGRIKKIARLADEATTVLSIIASLGHTGVDEQIAAFEQAAATLNLQTTFARQENFNYQRMNDALGRLRKLTPLAKPALIKACLVAAEHDGEVNDHEYALLQGIAATLDCPLPARVQTPED